LTTAQALIAFTAAAGLLTITPGLDTALVLRTAAVGRARDAMSAAAGICLGCLTWGCAVSAGLGATLSASRLSYDLLRTAGAGYLVFLGGKMLLRKGPGAMEEEAPVSAPAERPAWEESAGRWFARGLFTNLLNPKVGVFYITFLPPFVPTGVNVAGFSMLLAGIHAAEGIVWFSVLTLATRPLSTWLRKRPLARALDRATGAILIGFGLRLLLEEVRPLPSAP
jgi:threonine/homoserine/homoserine lactone efflux protein